MLGSQRWNRKSDAEVEEVVVREVGLDLVRPAAVDADFTFPRCGAVGSISEHLAYGTSRGGE